MKIKHFIWLIFLSFAFQSNAFADTQKIGEGPFEIDGIDNEWKGISEDRTDFFLHDLGMTISLGLQREAFVSSGSQGVTNHFHDAVMVTYDTKKAGHFKPKDIRITLQYADPRDGHIIDSSWNKSAKMVANIKANPDMVATGDVYDQAATGDTHKHTIEILFPTRHVRDDAIPIISIALNEGEGSHILKEAYDGAKKRLVQESRGVMRSDVIARSSWWDDDEGYTLEIDAVGSIGPIKKGFGFYTNFQDYSISVHDGFQVGTAAGAQVEFGLWNSGDLDKVASGISKNASVATPIGDLSSLNSEDGKIRGFGGSVGPAIAVGAEVSYMKSQELYRGNLPWSHEDYGLDRSRDSSELDEDRDRYDSDRGRGDDDHGDTDSDHDGGYVIEYDVKTNTRTRFDFPDEPADPSDVGD